MGVTGLWKLLEGTGHPVSLESLEGKVIAVDISIWLNMAVKGMRDLHGHAASNAHLITLFNRICKLLHFGIKPVFVFDGQAPLLKQKTLRERREKKNLHLQESKNASEKIMQNYLKREVMKLAIKSKNKTQKSGDVQETTSTTPENAEPVKSNVPKTLTDQSQVDDDGMFVLPPMKQNLQLGSSDEDQETDWNTRSTTHEALYGAASSGDFADIMSIDVESEDFKSLPTDIQHEMLSDIKEIRKRRRTALETMPEKSESFSSYQLTGLLAKRHLSERIRAVEKKMEAQNTASMAEIALQEDYEGNSIAASKISSEDATHYILIQGLKNKLPKVDEKEVVSVTSSIQDNTEKHILSSIKEEKVEAHTDIPQSSKSVNVEPEVPVITKQKDASVSLTDFVKQKSKLQKQDVLQLSSSDSECEKDAAEKRIPSVSNHSENVVIEKSCQSEINLENKFTKELKTPDVEIELLPKPMITDTAPSNQNGRDTVNVDEIMPTPKLDIELQLDKKVIENKAKVIGIKEPEEVVSSDSDQEFVDVESNLEVTEEKSDKTKTFKIISDEEHMAELMPTSTELYTAPEPNPWQGLQEEQLVEMGEEMDREDKALLERMQASARAARDVSDSATSECQELLRLFGIPFIVSPQEAEAQCAFLDKNGLTSGTITEDSDIWPFGGFVVFKDVFDRKRDPKCYTLRDITSELGLQQHQFINIALLSGSDYTSGIEGVGPVRALEIMKEFPGEGMGSMEKFKEWWSKAHKEVKAPKETKIKGQLRRLNIPSTFPSHIVANAYLEPSVNRSMESFSWGIPDLDGIRCFAKQRMQWTKKKIDDDLLPILKKAADRKISHQPLITSYLPTGSPCQQRKQKSKRVRRAITSTQNGGAKAEKTVNKVNSNAGRGRKRRGGKTKQPSPVKHFAAEEKPNLGLSESSGSDS
uniref:DNA repair protein complementing XP-G cells-like n=1 Tax=Phallusia mammillata TaxID=59560 RepID=A0A6F9DCP2_9ASCI|nr:DNA repair protein complementing XP-G cells-like [Phallusia mammillata]